MEVTQFADHLCQLRNDVGYLVYDGLSLTDFRKKIIALFETTITTISPLFDAKNLVRTQEVCAIAHMVDEILEIVDNEDEILCKTLCGKFCKRFQNFTNFLPRYDDEKQHLRDIAHRWDSEYRERP